MVNSLMVLKKGKELISIIMEINTKDSGWETRKVVSEHTTTMDQVMFMREIGRIIWNQEEGNISTVMEIFMKEHFKREWRMEEEDFGGKQEKCMKESGIKTWWMEWE